MRKESPSSTRPACAAPTTGTRAPGAWKNSRREDRASAPNTNLDGHDHRGGDRARAARHRGAQAETEGLLRHQDGELLTLLGCDSVIVTGTTTSGCVRATVLDAFSLNYRITVVEDACFDRSQASHAINLCDMNAKYADVAEDPPRCWSSSTRCLPGNTICRRARRWRSILEALTLRFPKSTPRRSDPARPFFYQTQAPFFQRLAGRTCGRLGGWSRRGPGRRRRCRGRPWRRRVRPDVPAAWRRRSARRRRRSTHHRRWRCRTRDRLAGGGVGRATTAGGVTMAAADGPPAARPRRTRPLPEQQHLWAEAAHQRAGGGGLRSPRSARRSSPSAAAGRASRAVRSGGGVLGATRWRDRRAGPGVARTKARRRRAADRCSAAAGRASGRPAHGEAARRPAIPAHPVLGASYFRAVLLGDRSPVDRTRAAIVGPRPVAACRGSNSSRRRTGSRCRCNRRARRRAARSGTRTPTRRTISATRVLRSARCTRRRTGRRRERIRRKSVGVFGVTVLGDRGAWRARRTGRRTAGETLHADRTVPDARLPAWRTRRGAAGQPEPARGGDPPSPAARLRRLATA